MRRSLIFPLTAYKTAYNLSFKFRTKRRETESRQFFTWGLLILAMGFCLSCRKKVIPRDAMPPLIGKVLRRGNNARFGSKKRYLGGQL
jgi:hypothetical protein